MLKRDITYEDFSGETVTETLYFNLMQSEIVELQVGYEDGLEATINKIVQTKDLKSLITEFKRIVLLSYGVRSEDGKRFIKTDELREEFSQTAAFDALFMDLATNEDSAANFIKGVVPKSMSKEMDKLEAIEIPFPPPPPPPAS